MRKTLLGDGVGKILAEKVREIPDTSTIDNTGKLYAYTQVAITLMNAGCDGHGDFLRALEKKAQALGCLERPWWDEYREAFRNAAALAAD